MRALTEELFTIYMDIFISRISYIGLDGFNIILPKLYIDLRRDCDLRILIRPATWSG